MRKTNLITLILLAPIASWSQQSGGGYQPTTPGGGYIAGGVPIVNELLHPPPPSITIPLPAGKFQCKNGKSVYTTYSLQITPPFHVMTIEHDEDTGAECDPSDNGQGGALTNSDSSDSFRPTIGPAPTYLAGHGIASRNAPRDLPAPGTEVPRLTALVRGLPFPPDYSPSLLPSQPACSPLTASHVFMVNHSSATVTHLNSCNFQIVATIPVFSAPLQVQITPDTKTAIVTSFANGISFIDTSTNKVVATIATDSDTNPSGIAISPDGTRAYVTSFNNTGSNVLVVDIQQTKILSQISVDAYPQSIFLSPDGSVAYVTFPFGNLVRLIDTLTGTVFGAINLGETYGVAFNSTGTRAYITSQQSQSVEVVDTATFSVIQSIALTVPPDEIKITPDDQWLLVNSYYGNASVIINPATGEVETTNSGGPPHGLAIVQ